MTTFQRALLVGGVGIVAIAALWWKCRFDQAINFLPGDSRAEWIIFPAPIDAGSHRIAMLDATFRRTFSLEKEPQAARLLVRAAKRLELKINGEAVQILPTRNWKELSTVDVQNYLRSGENTIEARVFNDDAPPALWLHLDPDAFNLRTTGSWQASFGGSAWRSAALATDPKHPAPGNLLAGGETTFSVLPKVWPVWAAFAAFGIIGVLLGDRLFKGSPTQLLILIGVAAIAWIVLFWNNTHLLPFHCGYDSTDHINYIKYIQERKALPLPNEGFESFQAPLYYGLSAATLSIAGLNVSDPGSIGLLRVLGTLFGIAHFVIVLLCLRLIFPGRPPAQIAGSFLAAFLPMQLYLSHYVTNETFAAMLISLAIYVALRILKKDAPSTWDFAVLGLCVGAALLTKATAVLLVPPLFGALILKVAHNKAELRMAASKIGIILVTAFAVCGWYYVWIWKHFGTPIVGNWERRFGFNWWQDPGFHTAIQYLRAGRVLFDPLFSGYNSFADGIYSTLWGDALGGGLSDMLSRTPWNYDLMVSGYWLALIPTLLIVAGAVIAIGRFARRRSADWFLLIGFFATVAVALVFMTLRVASYAQVKAFYGLSTLVPLCAFAAMGWEKIRQGSRWAGLAVASMLVVWMLNSFFTFWIRDSAVTNVYSGRRWIREHRLDAARTEATQAVRKEPSSALAQCFLAAVLDDSGQNAEAVEYTKRGLQNDATDGYCQIQSAINLARAGDVHQAMTVAQHLVEAEPENERAYNLWFTCAREARETHKAIKIGEDALAISPFDSDLHYRFGLAAAELGDFVKAVPQFAYALLLQPSRSEIETKLHLALVFAAKSPNARDQIAAIESSAPQWPPLLDSLAWLLATNPNAAIRNAAEAVRLSEQACALTKRQRPKFLVTLAAAFGEAGKFPDGVAAAQEALSLSRSADDGSTSALAEKLLTSLQEQQPYREESTP